MEVGILLVVGFVVYVLYQYQKISRKGARKGKPGGKGARARAVFTPARTATGEMFRWPEIGEFEFEVVGELNYQAVLKQLAGSHDKYGSTVIYDAQLIPEDDNEYDSKAIQIQIADKTVGYMAKEDARSFRRRLGSKGLTGQVTICKASITGGGTSKSEVYKYGVRLDLKPFD